MACRLPTSEAILDGVQVMTMIRRPQKACAIKPSPVDDFADHCPQSRHPDHPHHTSGPGIPPGPTPA
eukprot:1552961-Pyramimonas_sp.AAC.2